MKLLVNQISYICHTFEKRNNYFRDGKTEITEYNVRYLPVSTIIGILILSLLIFITPYILKGWRATAEYYSMYITLGFFLVLSLIYRKFKIYNYCLVQATCIAQYVVMFFHFIVISVFPYDDNYQVYISIFIMLMPALYIIRPSATFAISAVCGCIYIITAYRYKAVEIASQEAFTTIAALIFSRFISYFLFHMRVEYYMSRQKFISLSTTDELTSLLNRNTVEHVYTKYIENKPHDEQYAVMMIDIDDFKHINDNYGHRAGDFTLQIFSRNLKRIFEPYDIIGRIGGDEFFILMKHAKSEEDVTRKAGEIIAACAVISEKTKIRVSASIGTVFASNRAVTFSQIYKQADELLYISKNKGKNTYTSAQLSFTPQN